MRFPQVLDSSIIADYVKCPRYAYECHILGLRKKGAPNIHLHFGKVLAIGMEVVRKKFYGEQVGKNSAVAAALKAMIIAWGNVEPPPDIKHSYKTLDGLLDGFMTYLETWPLESDSLTPLLGVDGKPAVEFTFALPIPGVLNPDTGEPQLYGGRFDMLGQRGKLLLVVDEKTASSLSTNWARQFDLRPQFTGYCWGAREFGYKVSGCLIRGIGILKKSIDTREVYSTRPDWMINRWLTSMSAVAAEMAYIYTVSKDNKHIVDPQEYWPQKLENCCGGLLGSPYSKLCGHPERTEYLLSEFEEKRWNPLLRNPLE